MNDLSILHLSDLHIDCKRQGYSRVLVKLLEDIKEQILYIADKSLVVVVTGDILHQGPKLSEDDTAFNKALSFFSDLYNIIQNKVVAIYFVPGNHDKYRSDYEKFLVPAYRAINNNFIDDSDKYKPRYDNAFYNNFWNIHLSSYGKESGTGFIQLVKKVNEIFKVSKDDTDTKSYYNNTFGVDVIEVLGKRYCFVLLNTAWSCIDENDNRKIIIGDFQINKIKQEFFTLVNRQNKSQDVDLTIVLGHHPLGALFGEEEDILFSEMVGFEGLEANVYLCGHTHDRTVNNWVNNRHSINTFVTGIGWPEEDKSVHVGDHTYSMYIFNTDANSIDVYVRSTKDNGLFSNDFKIYGQNTDGSKSKIVFPIHDQKAQTFIPLTVGENRSPKSYYLSESFLDKIKDYFAKMESFRTSIDLAIEQNKLYFYDLFISEYDDVEFQKEIYSYFFSDSFNLSKKSKQKIQTLFLKYTEEIYVVFLSFFERICEKLSDILLENEYEDSDIVRFHFRYLDNRESFTYLNLCSYIYNNDNQEFDISEIEYGQLIEKSFIGQCSLIYSVNKEYAKKGIKERWHNFITIVPLFKGNDLKVSKDMSNIDIPFITFGVTTNSPKYDELLYCMDFFDLRNSIESILSSYLKLFYIDIDDFCTWLHDYKEKGDVDNEQ